VPTRALTLPLSVLALAVTLTPPAAAQSRWELGPLVAAYIPTGSFQPAPYYSTALPSDPGDMAGVAWGARGKLWFTPRLGLQIQAAVSSTNVGGGPSPAGLLRPTPVRVLALTAQGLYDLHLSPSSRVWISAGGGLIQHGGAAYEPYGSPTNAAGVLAGC
jgi:hypothetical protein